jgi:hypothetical protein
MADCHDLFEDYYETIRLGGTRRTSLQASRRENRKRIKKHFRENLGKEAPLFCGQGSYPMHTIITTEDGDHDLDDGVYLQGLGTDPKKWPTAATVHRWIVDAVSGYTKDPPQDKNRCVRVRYAADYHIDLPIYAMNADDKPMIFDKSATEPYESDPRAFTEWYQNAVNSKGAQLRHVTRYLKAWRDHHRSGGAGAASGLAFTILAVENFVAKEDRDDLAFAETVKGIYRHMESVGTIRKPTFPHEDLTGWWDETKRSNFLDKLEALRNRCTEAVEEEDKSVAARIWKRRVFGYRFPDFGDDGKGDRGSPGGPAVLRTPAPAILGSDERSA